MKQVKLADLFEIYGSHYVVKYNASIEKGIIFQVEQQFGRKKFDSKNTYNTINEAIKEYSQILYEDYKNLTEYHNQEIIRLERGSFLSSLINKDKKDKISYHKERLHELTRIYNAEEKDLCTIDNNKLYNIHEIDVNHRDCIQIVDLRQKEKINVESVYIDGVMPFFDKEGNISFKVNMMAFNVDTFEIINLTFIDNHCMLEEGYHVFNNREKAYDFSIEELMKSEYNENIKMRSIMARKIDSTFG